VVEWALVLIRLSREFIEEADLTEHRPTSAHLPHQPLDRFIAGVWISRDKLSRLVGKIQEDRARFEQREWRAARPDGVVDCRNFAVEVEREKGRVLVLARHDIDPEPSKVAHALNAIGLCAKVAIIFGMNPIFLVNASRVDFESAGTCSGFRAAVLAIK